MALKIQWLQDLKDQESKEARHKAVLQWLEEPITKKFFQIIFREQKFSDVGVDEDNWAVKQAHLNGRKYTLKLIQDLITHDRDTV